MASLAFAFSPDILGVLSQFSRFEATLQTYIAAATEDSALVIAVTGQGYMDFMNPTGQLYSSIEIIQQDASHAFIGSPLPYARRREWGFSGMTDSLGRFYPNDPGTYFFTNALKDESMLQEVAQIYIEAIYSAWNELVGKLPGDTSVAVGMVA